MRSKPKVYTSFEDTPEGPRWGAKVVIDAGERSEEVLYGTSLYDNEAGARMDAKAWLKRNAEVTL